MRKNKKSFPDTLYPPQIPKALFDRLVQPLVVETNVGTAANKDIKSCVNLADFGVRVGASENTTAAKYWVSRHFLYHMKHKIPNAPAADKLPEVRGAGQSGGKKGRGISLELLRQVYRPVRVRSPAIHIARLRNQGVLPKRNRKTSRTRFGRLFEASGPLPLLDFVLAALAFSSAQDGFKEHETASIILSGLSTPPLEHAAKQPPTDSLHRTGMHQKPS